MTRTHELPRRLRQTASPIRGALITLLAATLSHGALPQAAFAAAPNAVAGSERQRYGIGPGPLDETLASFAARAGSASPPSACASATC